MLWERALRYLLVGSAAGCGRANRGCTSIGFSWGKGNKSTICQAKTLSLLLWELHSCCVPEQTTAFGILVNCHPAIYILQSSLRNTLLSIHCCHSSCEAVGHLCWYRLLWVQHAGSCSSLPKIRNSWWLCWEIVVSSSEFALSNCYCALCICCIFHGNK